MREVPTPNCIDRQCRLWSLQTNSALLGCLCKKICSTKRVWAPVALARGGRPEIIPDTHKNGCGDLQEFVVILDPDHPVLGKDRIVPGIRARQRSSMRACNPRFEFRTPDLLVADPKDAVTWFPPPPRLSRCRTTRVNGPVARPLTQPFATPSAKFLIGAGAAIHLRPPRGFTLRIKDS